MLSTMAEHDISVEGPLRLGVHDGDALSMDSARAYTRIRATDLRRVAHRAAVARDEHPGVDVVVDIDVMVDDDAAAARARVADNSDGPAADTLVYVGTPVGLAGLIADMHALGICDGVVLRPLLPGFGAAIRDSVLAELATMAAGHVNSHRARPA